MIESFYVHNYKCLDSLVLDNLKLINVIAGKNDVGKTSILEALFLFFDRNSTDIGLKPLSWRGVNQFAPNPKEFWAPIFKNFNINNPIEIRLTMEDGTKKELILEIVDNHANKIIEINKLENTPNDNYALHVTFKIDEEIKQKALINISGGAVQRLVENPENESVKDTLKESKAVFLGAFQRSNLKEDIDRFGQITLNNSQQKVVEYLGIIEPRIKSIETVSVGGIPMVYADLGFGRKIPLNYLGGGVVRLFSFITTILFDKNACIFIDEFENGFHYSILSKIFESVIQLAKDQGSQLFISTHSYECLKNCAIAM